jgi:hypothetical protein
MTRTKSKGRPPPEPTTKSRRLEIKAQPGVTEDRLVTDLVADGEVTNASTALRFVTAEHGELSLTDMAASLREHGEAVNRGDLAAAERMLNAQSVALNTIFGEMARRAALNMGTHLGATESYLRLALKAQSQSRATIETLAAIKNPPMVFARQANIAHGPQQVNNGAEPSKTDHYAPGCARPGEKHSAPTELFEDSTHGRTQLDPAAAPATSRAHSHLAPMAAIDRPAHHRG